MMRRSLAIALLLAASTASLAQQSGDVDLRPPGMQIDNIQVQDLPIGMTPETSGVTPWSEALSISGDIFGERWTRPTARSSAAIS